MAKEKITLKQIDKSGKYYKVLGLENRMTPTIGDILNPDELSDLLIEAKRTGTLTIKIG